MGPPRPESIYRLSHTFHHGWAPSELGSGMGPLSPESIYVPLKPDSWDGPLRPGVKDEPLRLKSRDEPRRPESKDGPLRPQVRDGARRPGILHKEHGPLRPGVRDRLSYPQTSYGPCFDKVLAKYKRHLVCFFQSLWRSEWKHNNTDCETAGQLCSSLQLLLSPSLVNSCSTIWCNPSTPHWPKAQGHLEGYCGTLFRQQAPKCSAVATNVTISVFCYGHVAL